MLLFTQSYLTDLLKSVNSSNLTITNSEPKSAKGLADARGRPAPDHLPRPLAPVIPHGSVPFHATSEGLVLKTQSADATERLGASAPPNSSLLSAGQILL